MLLGQSHGLVIEQTGIGHLDGGFQTVFVGALLLELENVQTFGQQRLTADVLRLTVPRDLLGILRHHFRPVDDIDNKFVHRSINPFHKEMNRVGAAAKETPPPLGRK